MIRYCTVCDEPMYDEPGTVHQDCIDDDMDATDLHDNSHTEDGCDGCFGE